MQNFDSKLFLKNYWQKKPLKIKGAFPNFTSPLSPDELAGLSLESISESRIIYRDKKDYKLLEGPFKNSTFKKLKTEWTLLVQEVDKYVPEVHRILESFRFIPSWRIDDIMISYAVKGGGVGAHIDNYDVFLLQGLGKRKWRWSKNKIETEELIEESEVRLLKNPKFDFEEIFEPGDVLYLPPRVAHDGISMTNDCMTYSIGFRAPNSKDLIQNFMATVLTQLPDDLFYEDPNLKLQKFHSQISESSMRGLQSLMAKYLKDENSMIEIIGKSLSQLKDVQPDEPESHLDKKEWFKRFHDDKVLLKNESSNLFFYENLKSKEVWIFINGNCEKFPIKFKKFFQEICEMDCVRFASKYLEYKDFRNFLYQYYLQGVFTFKTL